jgi:hypothetical protein
MFMILLFNYTHKMFVEGEKLNPSEQWLPAGSLVQTIDFTGIKLERIGSSWRIESKIADPDMGAPQGYVDAWLNAKFDDSLSAPELASNTIRIPIVIWLAGNAEGRVFEAYLDREQTLAFVYDHKYQIWYALSPQQLSQLVPQQLLR